ncbi:hypothetical protein K458DRAFT_299134 [Lentithecium fluviatile CBS 122367]|uniref:Uncharacterized protein n=1 Tax=Lentithecium fluviatile CBS 122367 TaxID=1168545 RepID=A0A6G1J770_9PLEO|nr:hypothetical protein K458DRAFT_299134 [Lentithecium fluviatile CBS 122367]
MLETRAVDCRTINCHDNGDADCFDESPDNECPVCAWDYYCAGPSNRGVPSLDQMVIIAGAEDVKGREIVLTNFMEGDQMRNEWASIICPNITAVKSDQDTEAGIWHFTVQGTHKRAMSLTHKGEFLDMLVTWEPTETFLLPKFDDVKVDLCKTALGKASENYHELHYGAFNSKWVKSMKNRHSISISTPTVDPVTKKTKRGRSGDTIAFINIEFGDHNKDIGLFNGNGLPVAP